MTDAGQETDFDLRPLGPKERAARGPAEPGHFQNGSPFVETDTTRAARIEKRFLPRRGGPCQVCVHPDRYRIECAKVAGRGLDDIAKEFGIHRDSLWRHMTKHVTQETKIGYLAGPAKLSELANLAADENKSLLAYFAILRSILFGQLDRSAQLNKPYEVERLSGRVVEVLREIGKVTGQLSEFTSQSINITNNAIVMNSPILAELQAELLRTLAEFPDARASVVAMFVRLDERHRNQDMKLIEGQANG